MKLENRSKDLSSAKSDFVDAAHDRIHVVGNLTLPRVMILYSNSQISIQQKLFFVGKKHHLQNEFMA
jgi:hypothetical protein